MVSDIHISLVHNVVVLILVVMEDGLRLNVDATGTQKVS